MGFTWIILWDAGAAHYEDELNSKISKWLTSKQENNGRLRKRLVQRMTKTRMSKVELRKKYFAGGSLPRRGWRLQARVSLFWCVSNTTHIPKLSNVSNVSNAIQIPKLNYFLIEEVSKILPLQSFFKFLVSP